MKLETLHEAQIAGRSPHFERLFGDIKKIKSDLTLDGMAKFMAYVEADYHADTKSIEWLLYNGVTGTKDNPAVMEEIILDLSDPQYGEDDEIWNDFLAQAKKFFKIK